MIRTKILSLCAALPCLAVAGCSNFLTGGELSTSPTQITQANARLLFVGTQANLWAFMTSDLSRIASLFTQQFRGSQRQAQVIYRYGVDEGTSQGFYAGLYGGGALYDLRQLQRFAADTRDSTFLGIAQVEEAMLFGEAASIFGDLVYSKAFSGENPALDKQLDVYDAVQKLLDQAIVNLRASGSTNVGPGGSDLVYGGDRNRWRRLAFTLKARFYMHTAEVRGASAYSAALAASDSGITSPTDDYVARFTGAAGEQNLWYQYNFVQRSGYISPDPFFVNFLKSLNDPRLALYFNASQSDIADAWVGNGASGAVPSIIVSAAENLLIAAEAAYKTGDQAKALARLNQERTTLKYPAGLPAAPTLAPYVGLTGPTLLKAILDEKYIVEFMNIELWNDYKRNCYPNLAIVPNASAAKIPARLFYDTSIRNTNSSIPLPSAQPQRNANDPANATDPFGAACLGQ